MAKKSAKNNGKLCIAKEDRWPRAISLQVIAFLCMIMPKTLAVRLVILLFASIGVPPKRIAVFAGCCQKTVRNILKEMEDTPVAEILTIKSGSGRKPILSQSIEDQVIETVNAENFYTLRQIADMIKQKFGLIISEISVSRLLKKYGIKRLKCGSIPAKADPVEQRKWFEEKLQPLMQKAKKGLIQLLFVDASHFVMGNGFLGYIYGLCRRFQRTLSGRKRYNVLGAINFISKCFHTVTNDTYITATQVCELLKKIAEAYPGQEIYLILDNARYQKCKLVDDLAKELGIFLYYLPAYSPNLNLIERAWKFVKTELRKQYWTDFSLFSQKIDEIIASLSAENKAKADSLLSERIHFFDNIVHIKDDVYEQPESKNGTKNSAAA